MVCPNCDNKGWKPQDHKDTPVINLGGKRKFKSFDIRHYGCLNCGSRWQTEEKFFRWVDHRQQLELFKKVK